MSSVSVIYALTLHRADGSSETRAGHNLIMRGAIARFFDPGAPIAVFSAGTGTFANRTDSGALTFSNNWANSAAQFTVTSSAGFFTPGMVGCTLRLANGAQLVVVAFASGTTVTVDAVASAPAQAQTGTVFFDTQTGLQAPVPEWSNLGFNAPAFAVAQDAVSCTVTATYVCQTPAATAPRTIRELGWFDATPSLTGRADVSGAPLTARVNDYITCSVVVSWVIDCAAKTVSAGAFSGTSRFYGIKSNELYLPGYGCVFSIWPSSSNAGFAVYSNVPDLSVIHAGRWITRNSLAQSTNTIATDTTPTASTVKRAFTATIPNGDGAGTIAALGYVNASYDSAPAWVHKLNTPVSRSSLQAVTASWEHTVTRLLPA